MRRRWPNRLKTLSYSDFVDVVTNGRKHVDAANDKVMPSFATNVNVMCFIDDIYVYLRARANGAIPGGRPPVTKTNPKPPKRPKPAARGSNDWWESRDERSADDDMFCGVEEHKRRQDEDTRRCRV